MSHLIGNLHAYDVMGLVHVEATVTDYDLPIDHEDRVIHVSTEFDGTGESDPREWLRDVLTAYLECT